MQAGMQVLRQWGLRAANLKSPPTYSDLGLPSFAACGRLSSSGCARFVSSFCGHSKQTCQNAPALLSPKAGQSCAAHS